VTRVTEGWLSAADNIPEVLYADSGHGRNLLCALCGDGLLATVAVLSETRPPGAF